MASGASGRGRQKQLSRQQWKKRMVGFCGWKAQAPIQRSLSGHGRLGSHSRYNDYEGAEPKKCPVPRCFGARGKQDERPQREQVIAANLDTVFVVCGLDQDFNVRRIERYLTLVYNSGCTPAVILNKADLHPRAEDFAEEAASATIGVR